MKRSLEKGEMLEGVLILVALVALIFFYILPQRGILGPSKSFIDLTEKRPEPYNPNDSSGGIGAPTSAYSKGVSLGIGNAKYSNEPIEEYITIRNTGNAPVNITNWRLVNGKGDRTYTSGDQTLTYASDEIIIPQGVGFISPQKLNVPQDVILKPGEQAIVTTGSIGVSSPYRIVSFKENKCSGYLEEMDYSFTPQLSRTCAYPRTEVGVASLDTQCKEYVGKMSTCQAPKLDGKEGLSSQCIAYIKEKFSYSGCIAIHQNDPDFYKETWRIFLARKWELWAKSDENIKLYDQFGKLVDSVSY